MTTEEPLSSAVISAVAERENVDPVDLPKPLFEAINPDALDRLFREETGYVGFDYFGYHVIVESDGNVKVEG